MCHRSSSFLSIGDIDRLIVSMKKLTKDGGINVIAARMNQNLRQDLPHIFKSNELKELYTEEGWEIKEYQEMDRRNSRVASLIAQKIS